MCDGSETAVAGGVSGREEGSLGSGSSAGQSRLAVSRVPLSEGTLCRHRRYREAVRSGWPSRRGSRSQARRRLSMPWFVWQKTGEQEAAGFLLLSSSHALSSLNGGAPAKIDAGFVEQTNTPGRHL